MATAKNIVIVARSTLLRSEKRIVFSRITEEVSDSMNPRRKRPDPQVLIFQQAELTRFVETIKHCPSMAIIDSCGHAVCDFNNWHMHIQHHIKKSQRQTHTDAWRRLRQSLMRESSQCSRPILAVFPLWTCLQESRISRRTRRKSLAYRSLLQIVAISCC